MASSWLGIYLFLIKFGFDTFLNNFLVLLCVGLEVRFCTFEVVVTFVFLVLRIVDDLKIIVLFCSFFRVFRILASPSYQSFAFLKRELVFDVVSAFSFLRYIYLVLKRGVPRRRLVLLFW